MIRQLESEETLHRTYTPVPLPKASLPHSFVAFLVSSCFLIRWYVHRAIMRSLRPHALQNVNLGQLA